MQFQVSVCDLIMYHETVVVKAYLISVVELQRPKGHGTVIYVGRGCRWERRERALGLLNLAFDANFVLSYLI